MKTKNSIRSLIYIHFLSAFFSFVAIFNNFKHLFFDEGKSIEITYDWLKVVTFPEKRQQIYVYLTLFLFSLIMLAFIEWLSSYLSKIEKNNNNLNADRVSLRTVFVYSSAFINFSLTLFSFYSLSIKIPIYWGITFFSVSTVVLLSIILNLEKLNLNLKNIIKHNPINKMIAMLIFSTGIAFVAISYFDIYEDFLFKQKTPYLNEHFNIPSVIIDENREYNTVYDFNKEFGHLFYINQISENNNSIRRPNLTILDEEKAKTFMKGKGSNFYYDRFSRKLVSRNFLTQEDIFNLYKLLKLNSGFSKSELEEFIRTTEDRELKKQATSQEIESALKKNSFDGTSLLEILMFELQQKVLSRWYIHHHNFVFAPVKKVSKGESIENVFFQYGRGGGIILEKTAKLFKGVFNYSSYLFTSGFFYLLYFILFVLILFFITSEFFLTFLGAGLYLLTVYNQTYEHIFLGPGLNPLRHFFDIFVYLLFYLYLNKSLSAKKSNPLLFNLVSMFSLFNMLLNPEFGMFLFVAQSFVYFLLTVSKDIELSFSNYLNYLIVFIFHIFVWFWLKQSTQSDVKYYIDGFFSPLLNVVEVYAIIFIIVMPTAVVLFFKNNLNRKYVCLFLLCSTYILGVMIYYVWGATLNHLINLFSIVIFAIIILYKLFEDYFKNITNLVVLRFFLSIALVPISIISFNKYSNTKSRYLNILSRFKTVDSGSTVLPINSKGDFSKLNDTYLKLVADRGLTDGKIYLISKFDNIFNLYPNFYNGLKVNELMTYLMSPNEFNNLVDQIKIEKPDVLYVDSDILLPVVDELIDANIYYFGGLQLESYMRIERLNNMKIFFKNISSNYRRDKSLGVLDKWVRK